MFKPTEALVASLNFHRYYNKPDLTIYMRLKFSPENIVS